MEWKEGERGYGMVKSSKSREEFSKVRWGSMCSCRAAGLHSKSGNIHASHFIHIEARVDASLLIIGFAVLRALE